MTADDDNGFIGRWARRKSDSKAPGGLKKKSRDTENPVSTPVRGRMITDPLPVAPRADDEEDENERAVTMEPLPVQTDDHAPSQDGEATDFAELEAIDIESLDYDADFTKFMQAGVPERLRQRALRRLWSTNPILANVDGLNDYDEDFTDAALAVDTLKTAWKVGQGYLTDDEAEERDAERLGEQDTDGRTASETHDAIAFSDDGSSTIESGNGSESATSGRTLRVDTDDLGDDTELETDDA